MGYDELVSISEELGIDVIENDAIAPLKGLCINNVLTINPSLITSVEKKCILAEEIGHYYITVGDILDQSKPENRKQEKRARAWAYQQMVPISALLEAYWAGIRNRFELAEFLDVSEEFLQDALNRYKEKYGKYYIIDNYIICFDPLAVGEIKKGGKEGGKKDKHHNKW